MAHLIRRACYLARKGHNIFLPSASKSLHTFNEKQDRFGGISIDINELPPDLSRTDFKTMLLGSLNEWQSRCCPAVWIKVPISRSDLIPEAADLGFTFHHAENNSSMLCQWLDNQKSCKLPRFATHQVGAAGIVVDENTKKLLAVQDKHTPWVLWKFPGGLAELGEDLGEAAKREVFEETGIKTEFLGIIAFRQQHNQPGAFGRSDLYFLCHMRPLTFDITPCQDEIAACDWMSVEQLRKETKPSSITQQLLKVIDYGFVRGFDRVHLDQQQFESICKQGLTFKLHHCKLHEN